jgi:ureidoacrylate peracid hydrolase
MRKEPDAQRRRLLAAGLATVPLAATNKLLATSNPALNRRIRLDARPAPIEFDTAHTAIVVVDMQNDFGAKGGMFDRAGIDITGIQKVIAPIARVLAGARRAGIRVIYLRMGYRSDLADLGAPDSVNRTRHMRLKVGDSVRAPDGSESRILVRDTWNTSIVEELRPDDRDLVLWKTRFSGFYQTSLHEDLQRFGCRHLVFTGCTTSICVDSTVRDAMFRDYLPVLLSDCMSEPIGADLARSNHEASLLSVEVLLGWVCDSQRFLTSLG